MAGVEAWVENIITALKKAPDAAQEILHDQIQYHQKKMLTKLNAVPMDAYQYHMNLLRQLVKKVEALELRIEALEQKGLARDQDKA
jgi:BMFP domain-containing protein YqiC